MSAREEIETNRLLGELYIREIEKKENPSPEELLMLHLSTQMGILIKHFELINEIEIKE